jgi:hypothetical protein
MTRPTAHAPLDSETVRRWAAWLSAAAPYLLFAGMGLVAVAAIIAAQRRAAWLRTLTLGVPMPQLDCSGHTAAQRNAAMQAASVRAGNYAPAQANDAMPAALGVAGTSAVAAAGAPPAQPSNPAVAGERSDVQRVEDRVVGLSDQLLQMSDVVEDLRDAIDTLSTPRPALTLVKHGAHR